MYGDSDSGVWANAHCSNWRLKFMVCVCDTCDLHVFFDQMMSALKLTVRDGEFTNKLNSKCILFLMRTHTYTLAIRYKCS